jgi:hypothetical protein
MSGLCQLRLIDADGPPVVIRTDAHRVETAQAIWPLLRPSGVPWQEMGIRPLSSFDRNLPPLSTHVYPDPFKNESFDYQVGGNWLFIRIGQKPITNFENVRKLDGNFGVIYRLRATVSNPTSLASEVEVVFEASAGYSGALFILNGNLMRTPLLQPKTESRLARIRLEPGESKTFSIQTVPLSGSSYPASLTIRPIQR